MGHPSPARVRVQPATGGHHRTDLTSGQNVQKLTTAERLAQDHGRDGQFTDTVDRIDVDQLWRRNLSPDQMSLLRGQRHQRAKRPKDAPKGNQYAEKQIRQNVGFVPTTTAFRLAAPAYHRAGGRGPPSGSRANCPATNALNTGTSACSGAFSSRTISASGIILEENSKVYIFGVSVAPLDK